MEDDDFNFELLHGIRLSVREDDGVIDIHHLSGFLANAMNVFKAQRDAIPSDSLVNEPFSEIVRDESNAAVGTITLRFPGDQGLPVAFWVEAVIAAYTKASTLEQLLADLPAARKAARRDGSALLNVLSLMGRPTMRLHAFGEMMKLGFRT